ncbi:MAG: hypothetical protein JW729_07040 [Bacteroidales bacterium]|nr:hypothetical protein [Bacteroidales bacterium]
MKNEFNIVQFIPAIFSFLILGIVSALFGFENGLKALSTVIAIYAFVFGLMGYIKTKNAAFLVTFMYLLLLAAVFYVLDFREFQGGFHQFKPSTKLIFVLFYFTMLWLLYLLITKKLKWRGSELFELAAEFVDEANDSFTDRPRAVGKHNLTKHELIDFAVYMQKNLFCIFRHEGNRILLFPLKANDEFSVLLKLAINEEKHSWIAFEFTGEVSVHISQRDYLSYKDDLSFNQLSEDMGMLMLRFADQFGKGQQSRIKDRIDSMKTGMFI